MQLNEILVTDPCYEKGTWCTIQTKVHEGEWNFSIEKNGNNTTCLVATHVNASSGVSKEILGEAGVDSGQIGIFDPNLYPNGNTGEFDDKESFYGRACNITLNNEINRRGQMKEGYVTSTLYGDGVYKVYGYRQIGIDKQGEIVKIVVELE